MCLYTPLRLVGEMWTAHVFELEGVNNMIKSMLVRAPRTSLVLADAQIANRKDLNLGSRETAEKKWRDVVSIAK